MVENDDVAISRSWGIDDRGHVEVFVGVDPPMTTREVDGGRSVEGFLSVEEQHQLVALGRTRHLDTTVGGRDRQALLQSSWSGETAGLARGAPEQPTCPGNDTLPGSIGARVRMLREHLRHHGSPRVDRRASHETREHLGANSLTIGVK